MNPRGHYHTYVKSNALVSRDGRSRHRGPGDRTLWSCTGCEKDVWTAREDGPAYKIHPWGLNAREVEALTYLTDGRRLQYIALHMNLSLATLRNMTSVIRRKIGAATLDEAVEAWRTFELELTERAAA